MWFVQVTRMDFSCHIPPLTKVETILKYLSYSVIFFLPVVCSSELLWRNLCHVNTQQNNFQRAIWDLLLVLLVYNKVSMLYHNPHGNWGTALMKKEEIHGWLHIWWKNRLWLIYFVGCQLIAMDTTIMQLGTLIRITFG